MLRIDKDACTGCGFCLKACPFAAIKLDQKKAVVTEACTLCGVCVKVCPVGAITIERRRVDPTKFKDYRGVWIVAEQVNGKLRGVTFELLGKGRELANKLGEPLSAILLGNTVKGLVDALGAHGADLVYVSDQEPLAHFTTDAYTDVLAALILLKKPNIVLFGATANGRDLAPRVAARLELGLTADCTGLAIDDQRQLVQTRPAFGGNIMASILTPYTRPQMATVRPNVFKPPTANPQHKAKIEVLDIKVNPVAVRTKILESVTEMQAGELKVDEAEMVVSCGRGIKGPENIPLIAQLAKELSAAIGGSRPIVDAGWMKHHQQVGQSGRTISPKLYIACGISGAIQHLAGIQGGAETIVAVNTDPEAPIFTIADFGIVGDLFKVVPALVKEIQRAKTHK